MSKQPIAYPLRLSEPLKSKVEKLMIENDRTFKGQIEHMLKKYISDYEQEHGPIDIERV